MEHIESWIKTHAKPFLAASSEKEDYQLFFRDELRPILNDDQNIFSAADGIILYNKILESPEELIEVKGLPYSAHEILGDDKILKGPLLICGVFMTFADIHLNRVPYPGTLEYKLLDPIESFNYSMDLMEYDIFKDLVGDTRLPKTNQYIKKNARMQNRFYIPHLDYNYWLIQIADYEVNVIQPFLTEQKKPLRQNHRFSFIRWGSQVDLIFPLRDDIDIQPLIEPMWHVEAGVDKIISFKHKRNLIL